MVIPAMLPEVENLAYQLGFEPGMRNMIAVKIQGFNLNAPALQILNDAALSISPNSDQLDLLFIEKRRSLKPQTIWVRMSNFQDINKQTDQGDI